MHFIFFMEIVSYVLKSSYSSLSVSNLVALGEMHLINLKYLLFIALTAL